MDGVSLALFLVFLVSIVLFIRRKYTTTKRLPPVGYGLFAILALVFKKKKAIPNNELGDVYRISVGKEVFVLNSYRAVREGLINQGDIFSGRQNDLFSKELHQNAGIASTDGPLWREHRRYMLQVLRDFGMGKSLATDLIQEEVSTLTELISSANGSPICTRDIFASAINNIIARLVFGERSGTDDVHFKDFTKHLDGILKPSVLNIMSFVFPWILKVSFIKSRIPLFYHTMCLDNYIKKKVEQQSLILKSMNPPPTEFNQASNICEAFLIEQANKERTNPGSHTFSDWQITRNMSELFQGGTDTTATALTWAMVLLATHPEVQRRVQKEIEDKIGRQKLPSMSDRPQLPFVSAVMDEVMRYASILTMGVAHRTTEDTTLCGYDIPANTLVQINIHGIHHNPEHWARPEEFYPEHFLSSEGNYSPSKYLIPFSVGKRACLGESLARMEYFIALVGLMQKFEVRLADPNVDVEALLKGTNRIVRVPLSHEIIFLSLDR